MKNVKHKKTSKIFNEISIPIPNEQKRDSKEEPVKRLTLPIIFNLLSNIVFINMNFCKIQNVCKRIAAIIHIQDLYQKQTNSTIEIVKQTPNTTCTEFKMTFNGPKISSS